MRSRRYVPLIMGLVSIAIAAYLAISIGGFFGIVGATLFVAFGFPALKTALFASDKEVHELTNPDMNEPISEETEKKFEKRL